MFTFKKMATVLRIVHPRTVSVWWDGKVNQELITFDEPGYKLLFHSFSEGGTLQEDVVRGNIKQFLNKLTCEYDFNKDGPIHLDEAKVKKLLGLK